MAYTELLQCDLDWIVQRLPDQVSAKMRELGPRLFVAGGFIRSCISREQVTDIDIFATDKALAEGCATEISERPFTTQFAASLYIGRQQVQFIHRWTFATPTECITHFDFTIAQAVVWFDGVWRSLCSDRFYADVAAKRLIYTWPGDAEPAASMLRVIKFSQRGYRMPLADLAQVIARCACMVQGVGVDDTHMARILTGLLREVDPNSPKLTEGTEEEVRD